MIEKIKKLCIKYRELIEYVIVGCITTFVSWGARALAKLFLNTDITWQNTLVTTIGWCVGVAVAYPLNRRWVFRSTNTEKFKEFLGFASSRLGTGVAEVVLMDVCVNFCKLGYWPSTIAVAVFVTIANYVLSKFLVFRKGQKSDEC